MNNYDHKEIEKKWQQEWEKQGLYTVADTVPGKENYFLLVEFSYPSGNLHVGHWYAFAVPDILARFKRMQGYNVLYPMGFDAFGLPAENAAIKLGKDPKVWTYEHMNTMRAQLRSMGASFDWKREVVSCDPSYYRWTQWMFTELFRNDLAYRATTQVNWCPKDKTILANEQVVDGCCERCGEQVEQRNQDQWMLRIAKYADALIDDLDALPWPHAIKEAQKNWIGRTEGSLIPFSLNDNTTVTVFTTRAETLFGVTHIVLAPEHPLLEKLDIQNKEEVQTYLDEAKKKAELDRKQSKEKTGVELRGVHAVHPLTKEELPVWVADYVLASYGSGAVMAVPAHDERDFEFAKKYNLPTDNVVVVDDVISNSGVYTGLAIEDARTKITKDAGGTDAKIYRLRDWGISRQRYWGVPIPIVYDPNGVPHHIPKEHLPWLLPTDVDHTPDGTAPLARSKELFERTEKIFGKGWIPEVETMDTFVDSTWYFYRYLDPNNETIFSSLESQEKWLPVDLYMGGAEHTTMHLLYSRFWTKALKDLGYVEEGEAFRVRRNRGLILGPDGNKMSKSKGNVIDPDDVVSRLGADTVRLYLAFIGPYGVTDNYPWDPNGVVGVRRFLERVWRAQTYISDTTSKEVTVALHKMIAKVTDDIPEYKFNTALASMMVCMNAIDDVKKISKEDYMMLLRVLAPFAPHMTEELWSLCGGEGFVHSTSWPNYDPALLVADSMTIVIQVNGKVRSEIIVPVGTDEKTIIDTALGDPKIQSYVTTPVKKTIYVPGKLINIVL